MNDVPRLGAIDTCALEALKILLAALDENDVFDDLMEESLVETNSRAAALVDKDDSESMDEFYTMLDKYRDKVLRRTGQALADMFTPPPKPLPPHLAKNYQPKPAHPVARAYEAWSAEQSAQT